MTRTHYSLRLQPSLKAAAQRFAAGEGGSLNQFINIAVAEKLSALETETYFRARAANGQREAFLDFLDGAGHEPTGEGDAVP